MYYSKCQPKTAGFSMPALFERFFPEESLNKYFSGTMPATNISETETSFVLEIAAPSLKKEDFQIQIEQTLLTVKVAKNAPVEGKTVAQGVHYKRQEFDYTNFKRSFRLGKNIDTDRIEASYEDGILRIELSKKENAQEKATRTINIA